MTSKKDLTERDIVTKFIIPNLAKSGWNIQKQALEEVYFTDGRVYVKGNKTKREANEQAWKVSIDEISKNGYNLDIKNPHIPEEEKTYTSAELSEMLHESFRKSDVLLNKFKKKLSNG